MSDKEITWRQCAFNYILNGGHLQFFIDGKQIEEVSLQSLADYYINNKLKKTSPS